MPYYPKYEFLFKCDDCEMIISIEYEEEEDLDKVRNDEIILSCPCCGYGNILRN